MIVTCIQYDCIKGDWEANAETVSRTVREADADLIVLPELAYTGYFFESTEQARSLGEPAVTGRTTQHLADLAAETGATIVAGLVEASGAELFNAAVVVTPKGYLGTYRKAHLYYEETQHFAPGDSGFPVWTVTDRRGQPYRLGVMICFDWFFPEAARSLALGGADVIAHPSNLVMPHCPNAMPVRALENAVFTATANRTGSESNGRESLSFIGRSLICSPRADVLAQAPDHGDALLRAEIDPANARSKRLNAYNDRWEDRRLDAYSMQEAAT